MSQLSNPTQNNSYQSLAQLRTALEKVLCEIRQRKIAALRIAVVVIRAKRVKSESDMLLSHAWDKFSEMLKSPSCVTEDVDAILDTANTIIDLDKICEGMDQNPYQTEVHFKRPDTATTVSDKDTGQRYGPPVVSSRFLQQQAGVKVKPLEEPDSAVTEFPTVSPSDIPANAMWLGWLLNKANHDQLYKLVLTGDIPNKYPQPELIPILTELLRVETPQGLSMAHVSAVNGKLPPEWFDRIRTRTSRHGSTQPENEHASSEKLVCGI